MTFDLDRFVGFLKKRREGYHKRHVEEPRFHLDAKAAEISSLLEMIDAGDFEIEVWECEKI